MDFFLKRYNTPIFYYLACAAIFFLGMSLFPNGSDGFPLDPSRDLDIILGGGDDYFKSLFASTQSKIRMGYFFYYLAILVNYIGIVFFYRLLFKYHSKTSFILGVSFASLLMPYAVIPVLWYLQKPGFFEYHKNKKKLRALLDTGLIDISEFNTKLGVLKNSYFAENSMQADRKVSEKNETRKAINLQRLQDLKEAGVLSSEEFEAKVKDLE